MNDLISRQAAFEAFGLSEKTRKYGGDRSGYNTMMLYEIQCILEDLPSITMTPKTEPCEDCINRQAAIEALTEAYEDIDAEFILEKLPPAQQWIPISERLPEFEDIEMPTDLIDRIRNQPSAHPATQEPTAEWVPSTKYKGFLVCSACEDCYIEGWSDKDRKWRYCPQCGKRMR